MIAQTGRKGLINKLYLNYINVAPDYLGSRNPIPAEKQIVDGYWVCLSFFKDRERWHYKSAQWYFDYSREMEAKAGKQIDLAEQAHANYLHYLDLIGMATLKRLEKEGVRYVA